MKTDALGSALWISVVIDAWILRSGWDCYRGRWCSCCHTASCHSAMRFCQQAHKWSPLSPTQGPGWRKSLTCNCIETNLLQQETERNESTELGLETWVEAAVLLWDSKKLLCSNAFLKNQLICAASRMARTALPKNSALGRLKAAPDKSVCRVITVSIPIGLHQHF